MNRSTYRPKPLTQTQKEAATAFQSGSPMPPGLTPDEQTKWMESPEGQAALTADSLRALQDADKPKYERTEAWPYAKPVAKVFLGDVEVPLREDQRRVRDVATFMLAGNATFTIVSKVSGKRFTYKVSANDAGTVHFVSVLTGPDNTSDFQYLGCIFADGAYRQTAKSKISRDAPSAKAFAWFYANQTSDQVEVYHEGRCCRCGRKLTVPSSIESGIGPECAGKM